MYDLTKQAKTAGVGHDVRIDKASSDGLLNPSHQSKLLNKINKWFKQRQGAHCCDDGQVLLDDLAPDHQVPLDHQVLC
mgnify:CR=1 FL=1